MSNVKYDKGGLYCGDKQLTNFVPIVCDQYHSVQGADEFPAVIGVLLVFPDGSEQIAELRVTSNLVDQITKMFPNAVIFSGRAKPLIQVFIIEQVSKIKIVRHPFTGRVEAMHTGYTLPGNGVYHLPDNKLVLIWNHRVAGSHPPKVPCQIGGDTTVIIPDDGSNPAGDIVRCMLENVSAVTMSITYAALIARRSVVTAEGYDVQGALCITGEQSAGKTTLAKRVFGYPARCSGGQKCPLFKESVSTEASVRDLLAEYPDLVVVFDDICKSSEKSIQAERKKRGAAMLRLAANEADVSKKAPDGSTVHIDCRAGMALTAEFVFDGMSELTRCILVPLNERLHLTESVQARLVGCMLNRFADWFADHYDEAVELLHEHMRNPEGIIDSLRLDDLEQRSNLIRQQRVQRNLALMSWAFECLVWMLKQMTELPGEVERELFQKFWEGVHESIAKQLEILSEIQSKIPEGNLAYILSEGIRCGAFDLCTKKKKLFTHEGIIWQTEYGMPTQVGIKEIALVAFVRNQNGYHDAKPRAIVQKLVDIGALVLQETKTRTVHLGKDKPGEPKIPRVLLLRCDVLRDEAKCYVTEDKQTREL